VGAEGAADGLGIGGWLVTFFVAFSAHTAMSLLPHSSTSALLAFDRDVPSFLKESGNLGTSLSLQCKSDEYILAYTHFL
jgi:hypothetical protein